MALKETQRLMQEPVPGISATPDEANARYFHVLVSGPDEVITSRSLAKPLKVLNLKLILQLKFFFDITRFKWL